MKRAARPSRTANSRPSSGPSTVNAVAHASASMQLGFSTVTAATPLATGRRGPRVDAMGVASPACFEETPVIARGGNGEIMQCHAQGGDSCTGRCFKLDPPRFAVRLYACSYQLAANLREEIAGAEAVQRAGQRVDPEPLGDTRQVEPHIGGSPRARFGNLQLPPADRCGHHLGFRRKVAPPRRPETPQVDQRTRCRIKGSATGAGDGQPRVEHSEEIGRKLLPQAGRRAVEPRQVGIRFPVAHLGDHAVQRAPDCRAYVTARSRGDDPRRPARPHRVAAEQGDRRPGVASPERLGRDVQRHRDPRRPCHQGCSTSSTVV